MPIPKLQLASVSFRKHRVLWVASLKLGLVAAKSPRQTADLGVPNIQLLLYLEGWKTQFCSVCALS